ncbi:orotidine-5'-phosphate decarboxylase [Halopenitus sp. POP-27]|uniref:orotidine-5'-phosphate decarboxylase n=1 Tax=Halopenitus sp. POP-27 TaxID=2994425 RepID=UPI0024697DBC|nr:orotidine-5'-phosphate decarboxylase [Halopenitus sp. POP-27]
MTTDSNADTTTAGSAAFFDRLADRIAAVDSVVSVGLDPDPNRIPAFLTDADLPRWAFNRRIIDATHEHAACYKPNAAFYEDPDGWRALRETIAYAHGKDVPVLLDAKRADIGNTTRRYASALDDTDGLGVDAITVNPYMGRDSLQPFLDHADAGVFVLCRTSNPGGSDLQDLELASGEPVYERIAALADLWNDHGNVGLVVGATAPAELETLRESVPDLPFLVPGVGAQGGDAEAAVEHGLAARPGHDVDVGLVNSSRGIIFAGEDAGGTGGGVGAGSAGRPDEEAAYFRAAGESAKRLKRRLNQHR